MGCCGRARANLSTSHANVGPTSTAITGAAPRTIPVSPQAQLGRSSQPVELRYAGGTGIIVRGPATGKQYAFSPTAPAHPVDPRDAAILLRTNHFRLGKNAK
jgi:hypothetical protein